MFYGNFTPEKKAKFFESLRFFKEIFVSVYSQDNLIALERNLTFFQDPKLTSAIAKNAKDEQEISMAWRLHTLCWAAFNALDKDGDFVECGVFKGFSFSVIADYLDFSKINKKMYLYDTFEGVPDEHNSENQSNEEYKKLSNLYEEVKAKFSSFSNIEVIKGTLPESFDTKAPDKISLLHIDLNSSKSEIAVLDKIYDRVVKGGFIILDDFGWLHYKAQTKAEIEFMKKKNQIILELPTGQGLIIKN